MPTNIEQSRRNTAKSTMRENVGLPNLVTQFGATAAAIAATTYHGTQPDIIIAASAFAITANGMYDAYSTSNKAKRRIKDNLQTLNDQRETAEKKSITRASNDFINRLVLK